MALRSCKDFPLDNPNFIGIALALLLVFALYLFEFFVREGGELGVGWVVCTSACYAMSLWSYVAVVVTDPGRVPVLWGLYNEDAGERKFCQVCHNFKPERCHHCSKCRQCVLNMDHHCPWINNCVGFYNRKFFLLFLLYLLLALLLALAQMLLIEVREVTAILHGERTTDLHTFLRFATLLFCLVLFVTLSMFFHMHVTMVFENTTTLEAMVRERKRRSLDGDEGQLNGPAEESNLYDIGPWYNFTQVFGENMFYWLVPLDEEYLLKGKGIFWEKRTLGREASHGSNIETGQPSRDGQKSLGMYNF